MPGLSPFEQPGQSVSATPAVPPHLQGCVQSDSNRKPGIAARLSACAVALSWWATAGLLPLTLSTLSLCPAAHAHAKTLSDQPVAGGSAEAGSDLEDIDRLLDALIRPLQDTPETGVLPRGQALTVKPVDLTADPDDVWQRIRQGFAIRNISSPQVPQRMASLLSDPQGLYNLLERAGPYLYFIVEECERRGLPTELALLPFVESSFNPHSTSRAGAAGLWQFIPSTGKWFKLRQGGGQDERRDVIASTQAALDYLNQLYDMYGDWYLALAAYNWGEGSVRRALEANRRSNLDEDYLSLRMPDETRNYVPKLQAIKNIIDSPAAFGFTLPKIDNKPFFVTVSRTKGIDVQTAARLAGLPVETFRDLNPGFRSYISPDPERRLVVPADKAQLFENALRNYAAPVANASTASGVANASVGLKADQRKEARVGLNPSPGQTGINAALGQAELESGGGLTDAVVGLFRPYLLKPQETPTSPLNSKTIKTGIAPSVGSLAAPPKPSAAAVQSVQSVQSARNVTAPGKPAKPSAPGKPAGPARSNTSQPKSR